jgi:hypothetical protein
MTVFNKLVFPVIWFGFLILFIGIPVFSGELANSATALPFLFVSAIIIVAGYFIMKKLVFDLVDEVWDDNDALVIKNRGQEERIALSEIKNVSYSPFMNPPRVTLSLRQRTVFSDQITFGAPIRFVPFSTSPVINDLIDRVDLARSKHASRA